MSYFIVFDGLEVQECKELHEFKKAVLDAIASGKRFVCFAGTQVLFNAEGSLMAWGITKVYLNDDQFECNLSQPLAKKEEKNG